MKRPSICFMGDETRCNKVMDSFGSDIKGFYVKQKHAQTNIISGKRPVCVCIILERGRSAIADRYTEALAYSKRTRCPVYVICSPDQFYGLKKTYPEQHLHKMSISGMYKAIRGIIRIFARYGSRADFEIAKSRFETVEIHSEYASIAAFCADKVLRSSQNGYRIIATASKELCSTNPLVVINGNDIENSDSLSPEVPVFDLDINSEKSDEDYENMISELLCKRKKALMRNLNS